MIRALSYLVVFFGILFYLSSCGHNADDHGHAKPESAHENSDSHLQLTLDNGKKWQVDEHTRLSSQRIHTLVHDAGSIGTVENARALGVHLKKELDTLVQGCTMTGPAHDQLHVFLVALMPKVAELTEQTDIHDLQITRDQIGSILEAYGTHFE